MRQDILIIGAGDLQGGGRVENGEDELVRPQDGISTLVGIFYFLNKDKELNYFVCNYPLTN